MHIYQIFPIETRRFVDIQENDTFVMSLDNL